jgi:hypothetical protein
MESVEHEHSIWLQTHWRLRCDRRCLRLVGCCYPTSDYELRARKDPAGTARLMAGEIESDKRILAAQSRRFRAEQKERHAVLSRFVTEILS